MALCVAAVCPHPPLLIPAVAGSAAARGQDLLSSCDAAVRSLLAAEPEVVLVAGDAPDRFDADTDAVGSLRDYGVDVRAGGGASAAEPTLPLACTIGAWLLDRAGWHGQRRYVGLPDTISATQAGEIGAAAARCAASVGLLAMGDGSARRTEQAPGYLDTRAAPFDASVARALAAADLDALARLDADLARQLMVAGRATWQVLAGACRASTHDRPDLLGWTGRVLADVCPYGVGYLVAVLERTGQGVSRTDRYT